MSAADAANADHLPTLRVFISSPGDVGEERVLTSRVLGRLQGEFAGRVRLEPILWEHEPLRATGHFQSQITRPSVADIVICILWSRLGTRLPADFKRPDGSTYASGTEWEFEDAAEAFQKTGTPDLLVYRKTLKPMVSLDDPDVLSARLEQKRALDGFIERWFGSVKSTFKAAFHAFETSAEFEATLETHLRRLVTDRLPREMTSGGESAAAAAVTWTRGSPFRGLQTFDVEHAPVFFGRTRAIGAIKEALGRQAAAGCAFVLILGMSGGGKSSLARAGLLPTLTQPGVVEGVGVWRWAVLRPGEAPAGADLVTALAGAFLAPGALPELAEVGADAAEFAALLREAPARAVSPLRAALRRVSEAVAAAEKLSRPPEARFALVVDQLEELWTRPRTTDEERARFVAALSALARSGLVWTVATLRSDFYARCGELPELVAMKEGAGQYDLLAPTFAEIGQIIRQPTRAAGLRFEMNPANGERLDDVIHDAATRQPEALPLLGFTLAELYEKRTAGNVLTFAAYEAMGGLEGALARRAEAVFGALPADVQAALPAVFRALVTVGG